MTLHESAVTVMLVLNIAGTQVFSLVDSDLTLEVWQVAVMCLLSLAGATPFFVRSSIIVVYYADSAPAQPAPSGTLQI